MRIALMTNNYKPIVAGVPISIERLARGLEELGHEVTIFAPTYKERQDMAKRDMVEDKSTMVEAQLAEEAQGEENVFRYATCLNHFIGGIVLPNPFDIRIEKEFKTHSYDIIHVHHPMLIGRTAVYLSRKYHIPLVFTYHTRYEQYVTSYTKGILKMDRIMPLYLRSFLRRCSFVFAPTAGMQEYLTDVCKVQQEKTGILPTGIEKANFEVLPEEGRRIRRQYGAEDIPLLLTVSRMANEKNVKFLLESLARVKALYGRTFRMLMVGDGPDREEMERLSRKLGLADTVVFAGTVPNEEIAPYFKAADGFLFASKTETQGIVVLEAFAGGTPVIAVKASGVEDLVDDGVDGILTREDREEYARAVTDFLYGVCGCSGGNAVGNKTDLPDSVLGCREGNAAGNEMDFRDSLCGCGEDSAAGKKAVTSSRRISVRKMSENAFQKGTLYREEAVALKAVHYYNSVIAENETQKKRNIRLLPAG